MSVLLALFILSLIAVIFVEELNRRDAESLLREQQARSESLRAVVEAQRAKPFNRETRT